MNLGISLSVRLNAFWLNYLFDKNGDVADSKRFNELNCLVVTMNTLE